jgi:hypothetical protein
MADAYRLKADTSIPKAIREVEELVNGEKLYETTGVNYAAGDYVLARDITPPVRERAENGELDHLLEPVSLEEAEKWIAENSNEFGVYIPEHEAESVILEEYGHQIVPRDQVLDLKSAGSDAAKEVVEAAKSEGADERPALTASEVESISDGDKAVVPKDSKRVEDSALEGVEQPPGVPVGSTKAAAEGEETEAPKPRQRPGRSRPAQEEAKKQDEAAKEARKQS